MSQKMEVFRSDSTYKVYRDTMLYGRQLGVIYTRLCEQFFIGGINFDFQWWLAEFRFLRQTFRPLRPLEYDAVMFRSHA